MSSDRYVVRAGSPLSGTVQISGMTKNAGLKQMAAALLAPGETVLHNLTPVDDLGVMVSLLEAIGVEITPRAQDSLSLRVPDQLIPEAPYELVSRMRASINVLGPLLARSGRARVALPGGDNIGSRKLNLHFHGLEALGVELRVEHGFIEASCRSLNGARVVLEYPSVGATETIMTAAVLAKGETVIENAAREPEICDLVKFLNGMGAHISGAGTSTLIIEGVSALVPAEHTIIGDRIEAGTLMMACAAAGGDITIKGISLSDLEMVGRKLGELGVTVTEVADGIRTKRSERLTACDVQTLPYPGFSTDFMPLIVAALATADGTAIVTENIFEHRFAFVDELHRMGADVRTEGRHAVVRGVARLSGAPVRAFDVRAGAALVIAGLTADGETTVLDPHHAERGYADLAGKLRSVGADVERLT